MSIRAVDVARRIQDGQTLGDAASALVPAVLNMMRIRGVSLESPNKGEKVVQEFQTLWEAVGRRLIDRGHAAGLLFLIDPTNPDCGVRSAGWLLLEQLNILLDIRDVTDKWQRWRWAERPGLFRLNHAVAHLKQRIDMLSPAQQQAMSRHLGSWIKTFD